jgi:hypothetical protein
MYFLLFYIIFLIYFFEKSIRLLLLEYTMETNKKIRKNAANYHCYNCNYITCNYNNFKKHCATQKHQRLNQQSL